MVSMNEEEFLAYIKEKYNPEERLLPDVLKQKIEELLQGGSGSGSNINNGS